MGDATVPPPEEPGRPAPGRGWRHLLTELAIVVVGVCLALAAQQTADWLHWQSQVAEARIALHAEITEIDKFYLYRIAYARCLDQRADKVEQAIRDVAAKRKATPAELSVRGIGSLLSYSEWQSERAAQTLTHFPRAELALMSRFYAQVPEFTEWETKENDAWWALRTLQFSDDGLGPDDLAQLRLNLQIVRHHGWLIEVNARRMLAVSDQMGVARPKVDAEQVEKFCTLNGEDFARYLDSKEPTP